MFKNLATNPVLHPIFCLLLDLHPGDGENDDNENKYDDEINEDTDYR